MSVVQIVGTAHRPAPRTGAAAVLVGLSVLELGALFLPMPLPVVLVSIALVPLGVAAAAALWTGRGWGANLGMAVAGITAIKGLLGVVLASSTLARGGAGMALALGPICCGLLLLPVEKGEN